MLATADSLTLIPVTPQSLHFKAQHHPTSLVSRCSAGDGECAGPITRVRSPYPHHIESSVKSQAVGRPPETLDTQWRQQEKLYSTEIDDSLSNLHEA